MRLFLTFLFFVLAIIFTPSVRAQGLPGGNISTPPVSNKEIEISGIVTLEKTDPPLPLDKVVISYSQNGKTFTPFVKTDINGKYDEKIPSDAIAIQANHEWFEINTKKLVLSTKTNVDFIMTPLQANTLSGYVTDAKHYAAPGITIVLIDQSNKIEDYTTTDEDGLYTIWNFPKGNYQIKALATEEDPTKIAKPAYLKMPKNIFVNFPKDNLKKQQDVQVEIPQKNLALTVMAYKTYLAVSSFHSDELKKADILVYSGDVYQKYYDNKKLGKPLAKITSGATVSKLKAGTYTIIAELKDYQTDVTVIDMELSHQYQSMLLTPLNDLTYCQREISSSISQFWFCGDEAKQMIKTGNIKQLVNQTLHDLHLKYNITDLPLQIVIYSSKEDNAFYHSFSGHNACPEPLVKNGSYSGPRIGESIIISTEDIKSSPDINNTIIHEWGHGKDWRTGICKDFSSNNEPFRTDRYLGDKFGESFYSAIRDSTYVKDKDAGHPEENYTESFASSFLTQDQYSKEFEKKIKKEDYPSALIYILDSILKIAGQPIRS